MSSRVVFLTKCLLTILLSLFAVSMPVGTRVGATTAVAIVVYDHGLTRQINYTPRGHIKVNKTSTFIQDDPVVYAYFTAALASANVTWLWYEPDGELYLNQTQQLQCDVSPCSFINWLALEYTNASTKPGLWRFTLRAGGYDLYSEYFSVISVVTQDDYWKFEITQSLPLRTHGDLMVTLHPSNKTWNSFLVYLPFGRNITAYEFPSHHKLDLVTENKTGRVVVNLGAPRSDGYTFVLSFGITNVVWGLGRGIFVFNWYAYGDGFHSIPGSFNISLPTGARFLDMAGLNAMALDFNVRRGSSRAAVGFETTLPAGQVWFGWTMLYHDPSQENSPPTSIAPTTPSEGGLNLVLAQPIPFLPLTLGSMSLWTAIMSIFLLTGSELLAPAYGKTGVLINRRRLRVAALILAGIFLAVTAYEIILLMSIVPPVGR